jgi:hypothetical protein
MLTAVGLRGVAAVFGDCPDANAEKLDELWKRVK